MGPYIVDEALVENRQVPQGDGTDAGQIIQVIQPKAGLYLNGDGAATEQLQLQFGVHRSTLPLQCDLTRYYSLDRMAEMGGSEE